ncbi:MAG: hypothetical protein AMXMBFR64_43080 [Myxococcales bacterium]
MARIPFRARARTVDHLGREQIADCPTAVSELWKNAYDAYARRAELHIFIGNPPVAAVVDDGHGMSEAEFIERWLMLGTEAKVIDDVVPQGDRDGLAPRPRQGQKGIGRLSVAYLGNTVLVLTKRASGPIIAALIDWRLFQNPYLALDDVRIPVETLDNRAHLDKVIDSLFDGLIDNVWGNSDDRARQERLEQAWNRFSEDERARDDVPTADSIANLALQGHLEAEHLRTWPAWTGETDRGTAMFIFDAVRELRVWVEQDATTDDPEVQENRRKLKWTLTGFSNPYAPSRLDFRYAATAHRGEVLTTIVATEETFSLDDLRELEHGVEGRFDESGVFTGLVRAWGKDLGQVQVNPTRPPPRKGVGFVGPFDIAFGTFEQDAKNSTHTGDVLGVLRERAVQFGGLAVYRDGLRVQPYGRPENDFFGMEERRGMHAGREFWASRRTFGAVALTRRDNPHLRDKAGREGIIDNQAAREFKLLVVELLRTLARRYFGSDADLRKEETSVTQERYERARKAEADAKKRRTSTIRRAMRDNGPMLIDACDEANEFLKILEDTPAPLDVDRTAERLHRLQERRAALALPPKPKKLTATDEERYRDYRDQYARFTALLERASRLWSERTEAQTTASAEEVARSALARHQKRITDATGRWRTAIQRHLDKERERWMARVTLDNQRYYPKAAPLLKELADARMELGAVLAEMEALREHIYQEIAPDYEGYLRTLDALHEGIDLDAAFASAIDGKVALADKVEQWQELAQLGITVEIVGHELNEAASQVSRSLARLPQSARTTPAFKLADDGFRWLVHRLEFLAPLRLSGPRTRRVITGEELDRYLRSFFERQLVERKVVLHSTEPFLSTAVTEYPHRVFPVFVNLVNNALYWVTHRQERSILLDRRGPDIYIADSGPGIDPDDEEDLFNLFFTRRVGGRGVGLFLSRLALEQGRHAIRLASANERILPGANFILTFRELQDAG